MVMAEELSKTEVEETIPCGVSVTTTWRNASGEIVRQDVEIRVDRGALLGSRAGKLGD